MGSTIRNDGFSRYAEFKSEYDTLRKIGRHWLEWKQARQDSKPLESAQHSLQSAMTEYKILRARMRLSIRGFNESAEAIEQKKQKTGRIIILYYGPHVFLRRANCLPTARDARAPNEGASGARGATAR